MSVPRDDHLDLEEILDLDDVEILLVDPPTEAPPPAGPAAGSETGAAAARRLREAFGVSEQHPMVPAGGPLVAEVKCARRHVLGWVYRVREGLLLLAYFDSGRARRRVGNEVLATGRFHKVTAHLLGDAEPVVVRCRCTEGLVDWRRLAQEVAARQPITTVARVIPASVVLRA